MNKKSPYHIMSDKATLILITLLVTFAAIANLVRLFWNIPVSIGSFILPGWTGAFFFLVLGLLSAWSFRALGGLYPPPPKNLSNL
jgi:uncharacterized membrane protein